jgi:hypothetical protein
LTVYDGYVESAADSAVYQMAKGAARDTARNTAKRAAAVAASKLDLNVHEKNVDTASIFRSAREAVKSFRVAKGSQAGISVPLKPSRPSFDGSCKLRTTLKTHMQLQKLELICRSASSPDEESVCVIGVKVSSTEFHLQTVNGQRNDKSLSCPSFKEAYGFYIEPRLIADGYSRVELQDASEFRMFDKKTKILGKVGKDTLMVRSVLFNALIKDKAESYYTMFGFNWKDAKRKDKLEDGLESLRKYTVKEFLAKVGKKAAETLENAINRIEGPNELAGENLFQKLCIRLWNGKEDARAVLRDIMELLVHDPIQFVRDLKDRGGFMFKDLKEG